MKQISVHPGLSSNSTTSITLITTPKSYITIRYLTRFPLILGGIGRVDITKYHILHYTEISFVFDTLLV